MSKSVSAFEAVTTGLPGLVVLRPKVFKDPRGAFVKTFHADCFKELGLDFSPRESFFSVSAENVLRGMHFQVPPAAHAKLVYCAQGRLLDVVVDLRRDSPSFKQVFARELDSTNQELLFIPVGFAHGFLSLQENSMMVYNTDFVHRPACDTGIAWDSIGFEWPVKDPILSERDRGFPRLKDFITPF